MQWSLTQKNCTKKSDCSSYYVDCQLQNKKFLYIEKNMSTPFYCFKNGPKVIIKKYDVSCLLRNMVGSACHCQTNISFSHSLAVVGTTPGNSNNMTTLFENLG